MTPDELRQFRERRGESQAAFAAWVNTKLGRKYDNATISRWESGAERLPVRVAEFLAAASQRVAKIIAVANQKGGVGKTTTSLNLGYALGELGKKVLIVDADQQATATEGAGLDPLTVQDEKRGLEDVLFGETAIRDAIVALDGFDMLPCTIALAEAQIKILLDPDDGRYVLRERLSEIQRDYDYIVIDCPPELALITVSALIAADALLIPTKASRYDVRGIPLIFDTVQKIQRRQNPSLTVLGILPTMFNRNFAVEQQVLADLQETVGSKTRIFAPVPRSTEIDQATYAGQLPLKALPKSHPINIYRTIAQEIVNG
ncbi:MULTISPECIES: AAA family ATPase [unclassified Azospirillum]|uniref:AAA family ATPase n=1 Tax=unclassified Azospirillum TaxID=2630922 RepID=UPI000B6977CD|nr:MULTISPECIES: AAA family ATPase [unclassified Azospirillum]SNS46802.1 chromosome partitioning protein [Azospirillum sp. RU38E]SNS65966.1 chromosome partitioning protein [Azospirillum sp. RU37A]